MKAPLLILCIIVGLSSSCENETYGPYMPPQSLLLAGPAKMESLTSTPVEAMTL